MSHRRPGPITTADPVKNSCFDLLVLFFFFRLLLIIGFGIAVDVMLVIVHPMAQLYNTYSRPSFLFRILVLVIAVIDVDTRHAFDSHAPLDFHSILLLHNLPEFFRSDSVPEQAPCLHIAERLQVDCDTTLYVSVHCDATHVMDVAQACVGERDLLVDFEGADLNDHRVQLWSGRGLWVYSC